MYFFERGAADANEAEVLAWSFLIVASAHLSATELKEWAAAVRRERSAADAAKAAWQPLPSWGTTAGVSNLYLPAVKAFHKTAWPTDVLDAIGLAIQGWDGPGGWDGIRAVQLKDLIKSKPPSIGKHAPKKDGPPRYKTWQIVGAADIIYHHGAAIRRALG